MRFQLLSFSGAWSSEVRVSLRGEKELPQFDTSTLPSNRLRLRQSTGTVMVEASKQVGLANIY